MGNYRIANRNKEKIVQLLQVKPSISYWTLGQKLGVAENTVGRWLRCPDDEQAAKIMAAIDAIRDAQKIEN